MTRLMYKKRNNSFFIPMIYPCTIGGMEIYYYHLINELSKKEKTVLLTTCRNYRNDRCRMIHISPNLFFVKKFNLGSISLFITTFIQLIFIHHKISLIHLPCTSNSGFFGYFFPLVTKIFGIPYIIQFHGGGMRSWKRWDGNRLLFKHAAHILAVSETIKREYEKRSSRDIEVILPLIPYTTSLIPKDQLKLKYGFLEEDSVMIMVGSVKPIKGNLWVYDAFIKTDADWRKDHHLKLLFVGKGSDSDKLAGLIQKDKNKDCVKIIDQVPNEHIHEIYGLADYYIIGSDFEGTPKSLIEALFHGLPIIASNVNGIDIIIQDRINGLLVDKQAPGQLTQAIVEIVENKMLADQLAQYAKLTYQEKFSFEKVIDKLKFLYGSVSR